MRNAHEIDNYPGSGEPHRVPAVLGMRNYPIYHQLFQNRFLKPYDKQRTDTD